MLHLKTLGGVQLEDAAGSPVPDLRARALALLAVVAASGAKGVSRDRVLGILWPEVDVERGRHSLSQTVYSIHRRMEAELIKAELQLLRLDRSVVSCDRDRFEAAIAAGRWVEAVGLYDGPFADGFFLDDAPEFERWVDDERSRLAHDVERAAETAAEEADRVGDLGRSRDLWRRLCQLDPLNSRFTLGYVIALAKSGDRGGAVRHGQAHVALLQRELNSAPPTRLADLLDRLQRGTFVSSPREDMPPRA
jgi:serine/threonine-protein kinase